MDVDRDRLNRLPRWAVAALVAPPALVLAVFYAWPFATLLARALDGSSIADTLTRSATWEVLWFTLWQAVASTGATLLIGLAPTWAVARWSFPGRSLLVSVLTAVFVLPTVVVGAAFVAVLPDGIDRSVWAILGAHVAFNLAVVVRTVGTVWERLPRDMESAAATLGASPWQVFRTVSFPLLRPAFAAAAAIVFLFTFTSFGVIRVLGTTGRRTIEVEVWRRATQLGDVGGAAVLSVVQLLVLGLVVAVSARWQRRHTVTFAAPADLRRPRPEGRRRWWVWASATSAAVIVVVPIVALVERSLRLDSGYTLDAWRNLGRTEIRPGLRLGVDPIAALGASITTAIWSAALAALIGALAVAAISVLRRSGRLLDTGLMLPLGTSAVTIGFGMLITFDTDPVDWRSEPWLVGVGHALVAVPFVVRSALGVVRSIPSDQRAAAATLGASPVRAWASTTLPSMRRPLAIGTGLAVAISLGEFGATSFLSRSGEETLPIVIERLLARTGAVFQAQAFALATILAALTVGVVVVVDRLGGGIVRGDDAAR